MNLEMRIDGIEIRKVCDGWSCVKAKKNFSEGDVIEVCPVIELTKKESYFVEKTRLDRLCYRSNGKTFLPGGYFGFYIPLKNPNTSLNIFPEERALVIYANQTIRKGESIYVDLKGYSDRSKPKEDYNEPIFWHSDGLIVKPSPIHGLGVFTTKRFKKGEIAEVSWVYQLTGKESLFIEETRLDEFTYMSGSRRQLAGWATGYSSFYNHSDKPNINPCTQLKHVPFNHLAVKALKDLESGVELVYDSHGYP